jgi:hydroxyacylglutathione hydrolase
VNPWTDLGGGVLVRQSRAFAMNSGVLLDRERAVLVDPGVLPSELDDLARAVRDTGARVVTLVLTHSHWDHVLGRAWWPAADTVGHARLGAELRRDAADHLREAAAEARRHGEDWSRGFEPFEADVAVEGGRALALGPWRLALRAAPGHCESAMTVHLPDRALLFAGDLLSDREIPWLDREPAAYRATLLGLLALAEAGGIGTLVPGHGAIADGAEAFARIRRDLGYLDALESGVADARRAGLVLAQARERLAALDYTGKGAPYPMDDVHRENVRFAWEALERG